MSRVREGSAQTASATLKGKKLFGALVSYETSESGAGVEYICFRRIVITSPEPHREF
jgi:hypothetical protein